MPWSAKEMLDGQHQRVDIPAHARTAHKAFCKKDWKRISAESFSVSPRRPNRSRELTDLNTTYRKNIVVSRLKLTHSGVQSSQNARI